jgi:hypothetical protein
MSTGRRFLGTLALAGAAALLRAPPTRGAEGDLHGRGDGQPRW